MIEVTGNVVYANTAGSVNYHRQGYIHTDVTFDEIVNDRLTGQKCYFEGRVVWDGEHAGQVAIIPCSLSFHSRCLPKCSEVYYADMDWQTGTFKCFIPQDAYDGCCGRNEGRTASMQLLGTTWTPHCVVEEYFDCPESGHPDILGTFKSPNGGYLTVFTRSAPVPGIIEFMLVDENCRVIDTFISKELGEGWTVNSERKGGGPSYPQLPGYVKDDAVYICWTRYTGQQHCWMQLKWPFAPPGEQWGEECYDIVEYRYYELLVTPEGFAVSLAQGAAGPITDGEGQPCSVCNMYPSPSSGYSSIRAMPDIPHAKGRWIIQLLCNNPSTSMDYQRLVYVETSFGSVDCGECYVHDGWTPVQHIGEIVYVDGGGEEGNVRFVLHDGYWHLYGGCFWKVKLSEDPWWDYWYNHADAKYPANLGTPLAVLGESEDAAVITESGNKVSLVNGEIIAQVEDLSGYACCIGRNSDGLFIGREWRDSVFRLSLFNGNVEFVGYCIDVSDKVLVRAGEFIPASAWPQQPQIPAQLKNGGGLMMSYPGGSQPGWIFCRTVPFVDNAGECIVYTRVKDCSLTYATDGCEEGNHHITALFIIEDVLSNPVQFAHVTCEITGAVNTTQTAATDGDGRVIFETGCIPVDSEEVTFTIVNVSCDGCHYVPQQNSCTSVASE